MLGFDDFVNMLLEDVTEVENTPEGRRITKLDQILLNGNNITMASFIPVKYDFLLIYRIQLTFSWYLEDQSTSKDFLSASQD